MRSGKAWISRSPRACVVGVPGEAKALENSCDAGGDLLCAQAAPTQAECNVFGDGGHHDLVVGVSEDEAHEFAHLAPVLGNIVAMHGDAPVVGLDETVDHAGEC